MTATVAVRLGERSYDVTIGPGVSRQAGERIERLGFRRVAVVTDETVQSLHGDRFLDGMRSAGLAATLIPIAPGEGSKSFDGLARLIDCLLALNLERGDLIVAFGGGVVGDLAGFAAAIYKRGVDYIQAPTTLLAQVDSSVGGKTAIDTPRGKNLVGAFHQPRFVLADLDLLATLPAREISCGYAEILKCALLGDAAFFSWLQRRGGEVLAREPEALGAAVRRAVEMKANIVAADEREAGGRALLNLGHTFAHAIEAETGFGESVKHGEAVGLGCALAFGFSARLGFCAEADATRVAATVAAAGLPARLSDVPGGPFSASRLIDHMRADKKARSGALVLILARGIGEAFPARDVGDRDLADFLATEGALA